MIRGAAPGRRGFTLAEMIAAVALLALFSVFIVQMFVKADQVSDKSSLLDQSVACASDLADQWKTSVAGDAPAAIRDLRQARQDGKTAAVSLDGQFQLCAPEQAVYQAVLTLSKGEGQALPGSQNAPAAPAGIWLLTVVIRDARDADRSPLYSLQAAHYFPEEAAAR